MKEPSTQEFIQLWRNIQKLLHERAGAAKEKADRHPGSVELLEEYIERTKELFSYLRLMTVAGALGREVIVLKDLLLLKEIERGNGWVASSTDPKKKKPN